MFLRNALAIYFLTSPGIAFVGGMYLATFLGHEGRDKWYGLAAFAWGMIGLLIAGFIKYPMPPL